MNEAKQPPQPKPQRAADRPRELTWWRRWLFAILAPLLAMFVKFIWWLFRFEFRESDGFRRLADEKQPVVYAIWHEGLIVVGRFIARIGGEGLNPTFLISPSVDGEIGVQLLAQFGGTAVRGSARRSGAAALRGLKRAICEEGMSPCITLDGSKGPRHYCKPGAIMVARMSDVPVVPIGFAARSAWRLPTWDHHLIPKPFTRVVISIGEPYTVPRKFDGAELEAHRQALEERVNLLMKESEEHLGMAADPQWSLPSDK